MYKKYNKCQKIYGVHYSHRVTVAKGAFACGMLLLFGGVFIAGLLFTIAHQ